MNDKVFFSRLKTMWVRDLKPYFGRIGGALSDLLWWTPYAFFALSEIRMPGSVTVGYLWGMLVHEMWICVEG